MTHPVDTLPPLKETLQRHGLWAKKSLGQHFLFDQNLTDKIARAAGDLSRHTVIEIGPGPGGLTRSLLRQRPARLVAIEKDDGCRDILRELQDVSENRLSIIHADALTVRPQDCGPAPYKIVANLPYNISTALLTRWFEDMCGIELMVLMFQKEVAERLLAQPGTKSYGRLSVLTQLHCKTRREFDIPPQAFVPPPKITSTVVTLTPQPLPEGMNPKVLERITASAFGQRRKMLRASLKTLGLPVEPLLAEARIDPTLRAENLSLDDFCRLTRAYQSVQPPA